MKKRLLIFCMLHIVFVAANPLHDAVKQKNLTLLCELLKTAAKGGINECLEACDSPLHIACRLGYYDMAKALIEAGANIHIRRPYGDTPFQEACLGGMKEEACWNRISGMHEYTKRIADAEEDEQEYVKIIRLLISKGVDVFKDTGGKRHSGQLKYSGQLIRTVSMYDKKAIAQLLLDKGLRVKHSHIYCTALDKNTELARMLALHKAKTKNHSDAFKVLVEAVYLQGDSDRDSDDEEQDTTEALPFSSTSTSSKS